LAQQLQIDRSRAILLEADDAAATPADYDYALPERLIAQESLANREDARLLVVDRATGALAHHHIRDLPALLRPGDLLICNDTRVLPARLYGVRERTGGKWEGLFLSQQDDGLWELMGQTRGTLQVGEYVRIASSAAGDGRLRLRLAAHAAAGHWLMTPEPAGEPETLLARFGHVPLPPYIRQGQDRPEDRERYQTVFARCVGAVAAPTAGLHFTPALLQRLADAGVDRAEVTLHVGLGTFQPIKTARLADHEMHAERGELTVETARRILAARSRGGRIVAVGTTSVRVLETAAESGEARPWRGATRLFIRPPHRFRAVDALLTNFHLPRSTLLVLVSAFAGRALIRQAYDEAIAQGYRFYSYGDAMLIV
jgi:S-adenosylmethionine:tRNA ribosyltransferase-isomerase